MFWTAKVGLKCCCEKANIGCWAILSSDGSRLWVELLPDYIIWL